jgi:hypothetical protein
MIQQSANPNATNSELDAKKIVKHSDEKFYAQRDANFKQRVYNILFDDPCGHSDEEVLELIASLKQQSGGSLNVN